MHVQKANIIRHQRTGRYNRVIEMILQRRYVEPSQREKEINLSLYDREDYPLVEVVKQFQYLRIMLEHTENDYP